MGLIASIFRALFLQGGAARLGRVGVDIVGAIRPNATRRMELGHDAFAAAQAAYATEAAQVRLGLFDRFVDALNRLPRPLLALATPALFAYAMIDPPGFALRMQSLAEVPEPLWWLLGAVVAFYFGARETHYLREHRPLVAPGASLPQTPSPESSPAASEPPSNAAPGPRPTNPALEEWITRHER
jgi:hypothetical protein